MFARNKALLLLAATVTAACGRGPEAEPGGPPLHGLQELAAPAGPGSSAPHLAAASDGRLLLSWLEPGEMVGESAIRRGTFRLRYAYLEGAGWSEPRTVAQGDNFFINWADVPSVVPLPDGSLAAHWLVRGAGSGAYDVHIALSRDGGVSWSDPVVPHTDGTATEHGFVSLFPWRDGSLAAVWLDGRELAGHAGHAGASAAVALRHATITPEGTLLPESILAPRACDCCPTAAVLTEQGPAIFYRGRTMDEVRDISVMRFRDGAWQGPATVHDDGWTIPACPVNGPAAAADGRNVAVAWFTAARDEPQVRVAFSADAAASFTPPVRVDAGDPQGRTAIALLADGSALVAWLERAGSGAELNVRRVSSNGAVGPALVVSGNDGAGVAGFPRMARMGEDLIFAWTESGQRPRVRVARASLSGP